MSIAINVVFDGPPGPVCGRFVEVETDDGHGINVGEWIERPDGNWALRVTELPGKTDSVGALNILAEHIHETAKEHGWWDEEMPREFGTLLCLVHSEVSEALEAWRDFGFEEGHFTRDSHGDKPEGVSVELADVIIRVLDLSAHYNIDIHKAVVDKMTFNQTRPFRHGGKRA